MLHEIENIRICLEFRIKISQIVTMKRHRRAKKNKRARRVLKVKQIYHLISYALSQENRAQRYETCLQERKTMSKQVRVIAVYRHFLFSPNFIAP